MLSPDTSLSILSLLISDIVRPLCIRNDNDFAYEIFFHEVGLCLMKVGQLELAVQDGLDPASIDVVHQSLEGGTCALRRAMNSEVFQVYRPEVHLYQGAPNSTCLLYTSDAADE